MTKTQWIKSSASTKSIKTTIYFITSLVKNLIITVPHLQIEDLTHPFSKIGNVTHLIILVHLIKNDSTVTNLDLNVNVARIKLALSPLRHIEILFKNLRDAHKISQKAGEIIQHKWQQELSMTQSDIFL